MHLPSNRRQNLEQSEFSRPQEACFPMTAHRQIATENTQVKEKRRFAYGGRQRRPLQKAAPRQVWEDTIRVWRIWHFLGWDFVQPGGTQRGTPHNRLYLFMNTLGMTLDRSSNIYHKSMYSKLDTGEWPGKLSQLFLEASGDEARICLSIYEFLASLRRPGIHTPIKLFES